MQYITYGVRELQANLGKALRAVERGMKVIITSHRKPVAVLAKPDLRVSGEPRVEQKLRRLAAEGRIVLGDHGSIDDYEAPPISGLADQVLADRR